MPRWRLTEFADVFIWDRRQDWASVEEQADFKQIIGLAGDDTISVQNNNGIWSIFGELGNDVILADDGSDSLGGNEGNDRIEGAGGSDVIWGDAGDDTLIAGVGDDTLYGGDGNDFLSDSGEITAGLMRDVFWGGAGDDTLEAGAYGIDTLYGEDGNDLIRGGGQYAMIAYGGAGNDVIFANATSYAGGAGGDTVWGGAGDDYIHGSARSIRHRLDGEDGNDTIIGFGNDVAHGGAGDDWLEGAVEQWGWSGNDRLIAGTQSGGRLRGGDGNDTLEGGESMWGGEGNDYITVGINKTGWGEGGNDMLIGLNSGVSLAGMEGDDVLIALAQGVEIIGGRGNDTMTGAPGPAGSTFYTSWFEIAAGERDVISSLDISDIYLFESSMQVLTTFVQTSNGTAIRIDTGGGTYYELLISGGNLTDVMGNTGFYL